MIVNYIIHFRGYQGYQYPGGNSYPASGGTAHYPTQNPVSTVGMYNMYDSFLTFSTSKIKISLI